MDSQPAVKIGSVPFIPSALGLGCWALGGRDWGGSQDLQTSLRVLHCAYDLGVTHFDTAQSYGAGLSEQLVGKALRGKRENVFIASKASCRPGSAMKKAVEQSLKRMRTDYVDLFYIHWPGKPLQSCMEGLLEAKAEGKIRGIGISNFSVKQMNSVLSLGTIDAHQLCYNLLWRKAEREIIPHCTTNGISVVAYSAVAQGILSGKFQKTPHFSAGDHRAITLLFDPDFWPHVFETVQKFKRISESAQTTLLQLAILWVKNNRLISSLLVGARNEVQLKQNSRAFTGEISSEILDALTSISDSLEPFTPNYDNIFKYNPV